MGMTIEEKKAKEAVRNKAYREANKEKLAEYYKANKEKRAANYKAWCQTPEGRLKRRLSDNKRSKSPERRAYQNKLSRDLYSTPEGKLKETLRKKAVNSTEEGLAKSAVRTARRRCTKLQRTPAWAKNDPRIKEVYRQAKLWGMEVDHVVPLQAGLASGLHVWENLQLLHKSVNCSKSNRFVPE